VPRERVCSYTQLRLTFSSAATSSPSSQPDRPAPVVEEPWLVHAAEPHSPLRHDDDVCRDECWAPTMRLFHLSMSLLSNVRLAATRHHAYGDSESIQHRKPDPVDATCIKVFSRQHPRGQWVHSNSRSSCTWQDSAPFSHGSFRSRFPGTTNTGAPDLMASVRHHD
jgi:hypothetical protein